MEGSRQFDNIIQSPDGLDTSTLHNLSSLSTVSTAKTRTNSGRCPTAQHLPAISRLHNNNKLRPKEVGSILELRKSFPEKGEHIASETTFLLLFIQVQPQPCLPANIQTDHSHIDQLMLVQSSSVVEPKENPGNLSLYILFI